MTVFVYLTGSNDFARFGIPLSGMGMPIPRLSTLAMLRFYVPYHEQEVYSPWPFK